MPRFALVARPIGTAGQSSYSTHQANEPDQEETQQTEPGLFSYETRLGGIQLTGLR